MASPARGADLERGSASVVALGLLAVTLIVTVGLADLGTALLARARARSAADTAALAAAQELAVPLGPGPAEAAREYAVRNGGELLVCHCEADASEAVVEVRVEVGRLRLLPGRRSVTARARAVVDLPANVGSSAGSG